MRLLTGNWGGVCDLTMMGILGYIWFFCGDLREMGQDLHVRYGYGYVSQMTGDRLLFSHKKV